jgi:hypothetical protein
MQWASYCVCRHHLQSSYLRIAYHAMALQVLTGEDMKAMGMPDLAGLADGDLSPASVAALEVPPALQICELRGLIHCVALHNYRNTESMKLISNRYNSDA